MRFSKKGAGLAAGTAGIAGTVAAACVACCVNISLVAPLLAWFGLSALGAAASGWYLGMAGVFALGLAAFIFIAHRRSSKRLRMQNGDSCSSGSACKI